MNIKYHLACGVVLDLIFQSKGIATVFSVLPDTPLLINEFNLIKNKKKFNAEEVDERIVKTYFFTHSLFLTAPYYFIHPIAALGHLVHIVADWFTHTGRFSSRPFYPFNKYQVKFGREVLK